MEVLGGDERTWEQLVPEASLAAMEMRIRKEMAETLRRAAEGAISEDQFWGKFRDWRRSQDDPRFLMAWEEAGHYWGNFHERNIFFIPVKPNKSQLRQGQRTLRMLAQAFEEDWDEGRIEKALNDI